jgi:NADH-quinone oxidoreductase subunit J
VGLVLAIAGTALLASRVDDLSRPVGDTALFWLFAGVAIIGAVLMITNRNPVYSALWFAVVTLNVCGLFLLQYASFLAAATVVVYAGAIVVTFVFVIMLAQQTGATAYDQHSRRPLVATIAAFVLLWALFGTLQFATDSAKETARGDAAADLTSETPPVTGPVLTAASPPNSGSESANPFSQLPADKSFDRVDLMHALGRSLFGDYLFAVELAGTLLLVATIGAIAIAPRRRGGTL